MNTKVFGRVKEVFIPNEEDLTKIGFKVELEKNNQDKYNIEISNNVKILIPKKNVSKLFKNT